MPNPRTHGALRANTGGHDTAGGAWWVESGEEKQQQVAHKQASQHAAAASHGRTQIRQTAQHSSSSSSDLKEHEVTGVEVRAADAQNYIISQPAVESPQGDLKEKSHATTAAGGGGIMHRKTTKRLDGRKTWEEKQKKQASYRHVT